MGRCDRGQDTMNIEEFIKLNKLLHTRTKDGPEDQLTKASKW
jgi:hypothetical protein